VARALDHASRARADLITYQDRAVSGLLRHAGAQVPFYRRLFHEARVRAAQGSRLAYDGLLDCWSQREVG
jgi:phenylacetate-coenzyme A ligase PaaK-like adenylate-forming protein